MPIDEILAALESVETSGSFCTNKNVASNNFDIKLSKIGALTFPIPDTQIQALISIAKPAKFGWKDQTILDKEIRNVWEIPKNKVSIGKKQWQAKIEPLLEQFKTDLGLPKKSKLTADLHNMLIYETGHFFKPHQDTEKVEGMIATLVIILPTAHEGGELIIDHLGVKKTFKYSPSALNKLSCIAFYADCYHEVKKVKAGVRVSLTYNLILEKYKGNVDILFDHDFESKLKKSLMNHFFSENQPASSGYQDIKPPKVVYLLDHQYTQHSLNWDCLKNNDEIKVNALLKLADQLDLTAHLVLADMKETWDCEFDYEEYRYRKKRGYDEDEEEGTPTYIMDSNTELKYWINRQGEPVSLKAFTPANNEICWTGANNNLEPYQSEYESWQGNYGNTLDRWYHRAAIILWRKNDYYPILFEIDQDSFIQEIFSLVQTRESLTQLRNMLQQASPYWERYARGHQSESDIISTMKLALYLNNADISLNLLSNYELSIFNTSNIELWFQLINQYSHQWLIFLFERITQKEKNKKNPLVLAEFSKLIYQLLDRNTHQELIDWLIAYQLMSLQKTHQSQRVVTEKKINEMIDFISGLVYVRDNKTHLNVITYLMQNKEIYPFLPLVELFATGASQLKKSDFDACGYPDFLHYLIDAVTQEHQLGLRDKNDWSFQVKSKCNCSNCDLLNQFLSQRDLIQKTWPLPKNSRDHIQRELIKLGIAVERKEDRTGRPYKLVLTKKEQLYTEAENRYKAIEQSLTVLQDFLINMK